MCSESTLCLMYFKRRPGGGGGGGHKYKMYSTRCLMDFNRRSVEIGGAERASHSTFIKKKYFVIFDIEN